MCPKQLFESQVLKCLGQKLHLVTNQYLSEGLCCLLLSFFQNITNPRPLVNGQTELNPSSLTLFTSVELKGECQEGERAEKKEERKGGRSRGKKN